MSDKCPVNPGVKKGSDCCGTLAECADCYYWKQRKSYFIENYRDLNKIKACIGLSDLATVEGQFLVVDAIEKIEKLLLTMDERMSELSDELMKEKESLKEMKKDIRWLY